MTKFNSKNALKPAMEITDSEDAKQYLEQYVAWISTMPKMTPEKAVEIAKSNLGYFAGYYNNEVRERVERLFMCKHPVFGGIAENGPPSLKGAFEMGLSMGKKMREEKENGTNQ